MDMMLFACECNDPNCRLHWKNDSAWSFIKHTIRPLDKDGNYYIIHPDCKFTEFDDDNVYVTGPDCPDITTEDIKTLFPIKENEK